MVSDAESFAAARRVTAEEGLLIGGSCGTAVHAALVVGRELGPDAVVVVLLPDSGRNYLSKIFDDGWMTSYGFLRSAGPDRGRRARGEGRLDPGPRGDHGRHTGARRVRAHARARASRSWSSPRPRSSRWRRRRCRAPCPSCRSWTRRSAIPSVLDRPVGELMEPAPPMLGIGETVTDVVERLESCTAVLVLDGGHPVGVLTRSDVLAFLADRAPLVRTPWSTASRHAPSTTGRLRTPASGAVVHADHALVDLRAARRSGSTRATSTPAAATPPAARTRSAWRRSRARRTGSRSRAAWRPRTRCCACSSPASA